MPVLSGQEIECRLTIAIPRIIAIGTAVPTQDIHQAFIDWAATRVADPREAAVFARMAKRSGIAHRFAALPVLPDGGSPVCAGGFYADDPLPPTSARMALYAELAPQLAMQAIAKLGDAFDPAAVTHIVVASCTGFMAPGLDQVLARALGLSASVERSFIGFMGCYAAATALKTARHIVRSEPDACVLVVTVELSSLHLQPTRELEPLLAMLQFGDGAAAALVCGAGAGLAIETPVAATLPDSQDLISWMVGDMGFAMHLSGEVPGRIAEALRDSHFRDALKADGADAWAVHAGGRSILDAVEQGMGLEPTLLDASRAVLRDFGNMSSSTLMFVLAAIMGRTVEKGVALAFGPGLAVEGFGFRSVS
jgi:alpha-pyrone synthase